MRNLILLTAVLTSLLGFNVQASEQGFAPEHLTVEYQAQPMAIDAAVPRFGWRLGPEANGRLQAAYALTVVNADGKTVWKGEKTASSQSQLVLYAGEPLTSDTRYAWRVKVWLDDGTESAWSAPATFETGKIHPADFQSLWIQPAKSAQTHSLPLEELAQIPLSRTIWFDFDYVDRKGQNGAEYGLFRQDITLDSLPAKALLVSGGGYGTKAWINGEILPNPKNGVDVTHMLKTGVNKIAVMARWRLDRPSGMFFTLKTVAADGTEQDYFANPDWLSRKTTDADESSWISEDVSSKKEWAQSIAGEYAIHPAAGSFVPLDEAKRPRSLLWRRDFELEKPVKSARMLISSLGLSEFRLNGQKVGDAALFPNWTDFHDRVEYAVHDVTSLLAEGENVIGALTGNGWYSSRLMYGLSWGQVPALLSELRITYTDGSETIISTDDQWRWKESPIVLNHLYHGEQYDARLEQTGWDRAGFDATAWQPCLVDPWFQMRRMVAEQVAPIRVTEELTPVSIKPAPGKTDAWIVDFGQNFAGRCRITLRGLKAGQEVKLLHAETLQEDGSVDIANLRDAGVPDIYTAKGPAEVTWEALFTYHGFRYVEISGLSSLKATDIRGLVLNSDVERVGHFETSNPLLNRFVENVDWGLRSNYMSVPTDCPQRSERLGWTGDAQAMQPSAQYLRDSARFYSKWNWDLVDSGGAPNQAPLPYTVDIAAPGWSDAVTIIPWNLYLFYGDTRPMKASYPGMKQFVDRMLAEAEEMGTPYLYWKNGYGDHVSLDHQERKAFGAYYCYHSTDLLSRMASVLGQTADAKYYSSLLPKIAEAINEEWINKDPRFGRSNQSEIAVPLAFGIVPKDQQKEKVEKLVSLIKSQDSAPRTGFLGTAVLLPVLSNNGYHDLAGEMALREESPSWLHMVKAGATTVWERWNSDTAGSGMNSRNHFLFGAVTEWYFGYLAGIKPDPEYPGFKHFFVRPMPIAGLDFIKAEHETLYGAIRVEWRRQGQVIDMTLTVPGNTVATVQLPERPRVSPVVNMQQNGDVWSGRLRPGTYQFTYQEQSRRD